ncbi:hypothetical protein [Mycobacterium sp. 3519A]|uniref:hypothetical protein n=1 Tax=Mycobacterium sp. 3519A TaxID=2057184 RepID=UPI000C7D2A22|nr:hypothetical protein [Mycobacterium sp. 3519A]
MPSRKNAAVKILAVGIGAPLVVLMVGSPTALAKPCSASCSVGGAEGGNGAIKSNNKAKGGQLVGPRGGINAGTAATISPPVSAGRVVTAPGSQFGAGTMSGNFSKTPVKGRCTGGLASFCN